MVGSTLDSMSFELPYINFRLQHHRIISINLNHAPAHYFWRFTTNHRVKIFGTTCEISRSQGAPQQVVSPVVFQERTCACRHAHTDAYTHTCFQISGH